MKFVWKEEYSVGVSEIDEQHKRFFSIINKLDEAIKSGGSRENTVRVLTDLASYANYHFSTEEKYFAEFNYKEGDTHTAIHDSYEYKLEEFIDQLSGDTTQLSVDMAQFSQDWLLNHILIEDKKYSDTFIKHGLK